MNISDNNNPTISGSPISAPPKCSTETFCAVKSYTLEEKLEKFIYLFFQALFTFGFALASSKTRRRWVKLFFVKASNKQVLKITRVALNQEKVFQKSKEELAEIQNQLNERNIPLNCKNPPRQKELNDFNRCEIQEYLSYAKANDPVNYNYVKSFYETVLDKITVTELDESLAACTKLLDTHLKYDYDVGFVPEKSSKWIAELAIPYLSKAPSHYFEHATDKGGTQSKLSSKTRQFVIFDDASYSGKQIISIVKSMQKQLAGQRKKGELFLVIPFISSLAQEYIISEMTRAMNPQSSARKYFSKLKIHMITSNRKIKAMNDVYPDCRDTSCVTFTEWKIPDTISLPGHFRRAVFRDANGEKKHVNFMTDYPPCYKTDKKA